MLGKKGDGRLWSWLSGVGRTKVKEEEEEEEEGDILLRHDGLCMYSFAH